MVVRVDRLCNSFKNKNKNRRKYTKIHGTLIFEMFIIKCPTLCMRSPLVIKILHYSIEFETKIFKILVYF